MSERTSTAFIWIWIGALFTANAWLALTLPDSAGHALLHVRPFPVAPHLVPMEGLGVWLGDTLAAVPALGVYMWRNRLRVVASTSA